ncbi:MAG: hypothetical protein JWP11_2837 [Frankiales bacterium]|nr:hypothetical protein [Frankiales bacterium]
MSERFSAVCRRSAGCEYTESVECESCGEPLPVGTPAKANLDGVIICVECFHALDGAS